MAKSPFEKAMEKQQREAKRLAGQEAIRQRANAIVSGQPVIGEMRIMDTASEEILKILLSAYDGNSGRKVNSKPDMIPDAYADSLPLEFEKLSMYGMVFNPRVWVRNVWEVTLTPQGVTYFEDKERAMEKAKSEKANQLNIGSIVANGSNLVLGDVINSTLSIDDFTSRIEQEIEEKGEEEKEELRETLEEVKELIENMQDSRHIPKNKGLFSKLSNHLEKHGWFYGEIVGLLGSAVMQMLPK